MNPAPASIPQPNPAIIFETLNAYQRSAALKAAIELDVFSEIGRGSRTVDEIAKGVHASARGIRILCDYLVVIGFLSKETDRYALTLDSAMFLDRSSPAYFGSTANFLLDPRLTAPFL
ncbi:MAG TPA: methyltransferase dimerization domain-containing protein, partial [Bryobacteraceae bacterium]|nr:methyltransferase dimerization domain-containing protein [Bryobacteraceae bacterium]